MPGSTSGIGERAKNRCFSRSGFSLSESKRQAKGLTYVDVYRFGSKPGRSRRSDCGAAGCAAHCSQSADCGRIEAGRQHRDQRLLSDSGRSRPTNFCRFRRAKKHCRGRTSVRWHRPIWSISNNRSEPARPDWRALTSPVTSMPSARSVRVNDEGEWCRMWFTAPAPFNLLKWPAKARSPWMVSA